MFERRDREIVGRVEAGESYGDIAPDYGLKPATVRRIYYKRARGEVAAGHSAERERVESRMKALGIPATPANIARCMGMTDRAMRLFGKYLRKQSYYDLFGEEVPSPAYRGAPDES